MRGVRCEMTSTARRASESGRRKGSANGNACGQVHTMPTSGERRLVAIVHAHDVVTVTRTSRQVGHVEGTELAAQATQQRRARTTRRVATHHHPPPLRRLHHHNHHHHHHHHLHHHHLLLLRPLLPSLRCTLTLTLTRRPTPSLPTDSSPTGRQCRRRTGRATSRRWRPQRGRADGPSLRRASRCPLTPTTSRSFGRLTSVPNGCGSSPRRWTRLGWLARFVTQSWPSWRGGKRSTFGRAACAWQALPLSRLALLVAVPLARFALFAWSAPTTCTR
mmetsp:Transcript_1587/g.5078  ORF Transcript_1587/g.5078 Transcript_1587/m.5078 type:complete len:276 (-) Transcript_1587:1117-1944(-)